MAEKGFDVIPICLFWINYFFIKVLKLKKRKEKDAENHSQTLENLREEGEEGIGL